MNKFKVRALANFINAPMSSISGVSEHMFAHYDQEFLVLSEDEANDAVKEQLEMQLGEGLLEKIPNIDRFTQDMIDEKGRGAFLADDGEENSENAYYIYRLN